MKIFIRQILNSLTPTSVLEKRIQVGATYRFHTDDDPWGLNLNYKVVEIRDGYVRCEVTLGEKNTHKSLSTCTYYELLTFYNIFKGDKEL